MAPIEERSRDPERSNAVAMELAARRWLSVSVIAFSAMVAALAAIIEIHDWVSGQGSLASVLVAVGMTAWWIVIAAYLNDPNTR